MQNARTTPACRSPPPCGCRSFVPGHILPAPVTTLPRACWDSSGCDDSGGEVDHGGEARIGLVAAHCDALELLQLAEEVLDQMTPCVHVLVDGARLAATGMLRDDGLGAAAIEVGDDGVCIEGLVGDQRPERHAIDERRHAGGLEALPRKEHEAHEIAECVRQRHDLCRHAAFGAADGLALSPPFAPCPWR